VKAPTFSEFSTKYAKEVPTLTKKRWPWITVALVAVIALATVGAVLYHNAQKPTRPAETEPAFCADGFWQYEKAYLKDVYFSQGKVYYTVVNDTGFSFDAGERPKVYRKENGVWTQHHIWQNTTEMGAHLKPRASGSYSEAVRRFSTEADLIGEYLLTYGERKGSNGEVHAIVGYLTITEEMIDYMGIEGELYYTDDGIRQNTLLTLQDLRFDRYVVSYTVTNNTGVPQASWYQPVIEKKVNGSWQRVVTDPLYDNDLVWELAHGESASGWFHMPHAGLSLVGEYRFIFGGSPGDPVSKYTDLIVAELTITAEMLEGVV